MEFQESNKVAFLEFNNHFQNQIIYHAIFIDEFLGKIRRVVSPEIFKTKEKRLFVEMIYEYYDEFDKAPQENFFDLFDERKEKLTDDQYNRCVDLINLLTQITGSNWEYVQQRIKDAIMHYQMEEAIVECAAKVKTGEYDLVKGIILKALKEPENFDPAYYDFFKDNMWMHTRSQGQTYRMVSGIKDLDRMLGGFKDKWLVTLLGATKGGKTWWLIEIAISAVFQGLNVLFVSLEMGKEQIDERFDMTMAFATSSTDNKVSTMRQIDGKWVAIDENMPNVFDIDYIRKERNKFKNISGGSLKVMAFDRGRVNYQNIDVALDELEEREGWICNVLVVDYLGIMKETQPGQTKKERISENCLGLKEMAGKRNILCFSAMQGNRKAMTAETFHSYLVADDIDTIFNSDLVLALCQTKVEELQNKFRMYIANYRHGKQHGMIGMVRDLTIGQVCVGTYEIKEKLNDEGEAGEDY